MRKSDFINKLKETLEIENQAITENTNLEEIKSYDSLAVMALIALTDELFRKKLIAQDITRATTVLDLMKMIGLENFE